MTSTLRAVGEKCHCSGDKGDFSGWVRWDGQDAFALEVTCEQTPEGTGVCCRTGGLRVVQEEGCQDCASLGAPMTQATAEKARARERQSKLVVFHPFFELTVLCYHLAGTQLLCYILFFLFSLL